MDKNIVKDPQNAFWLQTAKGKFYPDFIIKLANGKTVVAEYKGEHLKNEDTMRKEEIGEYWAGLSDECEFLMLYKGDYKEKLNVLLGGKSNASLSHMIDKTVQTSQSIEGYGDVDKSTAEEVKKLRNEYDIKISTRS